MMIRNPNWSRKWKQTENQIKRNKFNPLHYLMGWVVERVRETVSSCVHPQVNEFEGKSIPFDRIFFLFENARNCSFFFRIFNLKYTQGNWRKRIWRKFSNLNFYSFLVSNWNPSKFYLHDDDDEHHHDNSVFITWLFHILLGDFWWQRLFIDSHWRFNCFLHLI